MGGKSRARTTKGTDCVDYPVHVCWGVVLLRIALRHLTMQPWLAELKRNEALRRLPGTAKRR